MARRGAGGAGSCSSPLPREGSRRPFGNARDLKAELWWIAEHTEETAIAAVRPTRNRRVFWNDRGRSRRGTDCLGYWISPRRPKRIIQSRSPRRQELASEFSHGETTISPDGRFPRFHRGEGQAAISLAATAGFLRRPPARGTEGRGPAVLVSRRRTLFFLSQNKLRKLDISSAAPYRPVADRLEAAGRDSSRQTAPSFFQRRPSRY